MKFLRQWWVFEKLGISFNLLGRKSIFEKFKICFGKERDCYLPELRVEAFGFRTKMDFEKD
jgi:hypothetical protein